MKIEIKNRLTGQIIISGEYKSVRDCLEKNRGSDLSYSDLSYSDLSGSDLRGSNLRGSNLSYSNLSYSDLRGSDLRGYRDSHDIFAEIVRRQKVNVFLDAEWVAIAQITILRLCWDAIKKRFSDVMPSIFRKLADAGFDEWLKHWEEITK